MAEFQVIFMDAGQGDCTLVVYPDKSLMLVDCGSTKSGDEAFTQIWKVLEYYLQTNHNVINNLVLTHPDEDHYNKLRHLLNRKNAPMIEQVYYGGHIDLYGNLKDADFTVDFLRQHPNSGPPPNTHSTKPDANLSRAGINVYILAANASGSAKGRTGAFKNKNSIVLMLEFPSICKVFLMGDAFEETEEEIISVFKTNGKLSLLQKPGVEETVLKMGHHGSDTSTGPNWIKTIEPNILVVSSGTKSFNRKGMPTVKHLGDTAAASPLVRDTGIHQTYVEFDPTQERGKNFIICPSTTKGIWTTCFGVKWLDGRWWEAGQAWYYGVTTQRRETKLRWYGYTGYEEVEDVNEADGAMEVEDKGGLEEER